MRLRLISLFVLVLVIVSGCSYTLEMPNDVIGNYEAKDYENIKTRTFDAKTDLLSFIKNNRDTYSQTYLNSFRGGDVMLQSETLDSVPVSKSSISEGNDFSETNNQVSGIDEADIIKTDGNYIYTITGNTLFIVKAYPGEDAKVLSKITLDKTASGIFVKGNNLAVFGNVDDRNIFSTLKIKTSLSFLNLYDLEDKTNPRLIKEYYLEGSYFDGRQKGDYMYLITNSYPEYRVDTPMPLIIEDGIKKSVPINNIYYYDIPYKSPIFVNIHAINLGNLFDEMTSESLLVENSQKMYMSEDNLYLTYTEYVNEYVIKKEVMMDLVGPLLTPYEFDLINKIKNTDNDVLSQYEKEQKVYQVYDNFVYYMDSDDREKLQKEIDSQVKSRLESMKFFEFTIINKIELFKNKITPVANGKIPGHIINQFSLDEHDENLRIATTINPRWSRYIETQKESSNNIYILDKGLKEVGSLTGLAKNERIFSTRFIGDRLYMVTFKQVDPFFIIDLSNSTNPKELGELKIPGFSRYLHPYDDNIIIGIGKDATETGRTKGLKISLFNIKDVKNPEEVAKYTLSSDYSNSNALYEHKAFLFSKEKNLLVIPAYSYDVDDSSSYNGALVFNITNNSIKLRGLISHDNGREYWQPSVERSLYIENLLYTKSPNLLRINSLYDLHSVNNISLIGKKDIEIY